MIGHTCVNNLLQVEVVMVVAPWVGLMVIALAMVFFVTLFISGRRRLRRVDLNLRRYPELARLRASTLSSRYSGCGAAVICRVVVSCVLPLGLGFSITPAVAATVLVIAVMLGQRRAYRAAQVPGQAALERRSVVTYLPVGLTSLCISIAAGLTGLMAWTTAVAVPDDMGRPGRNYAWSCTVTSRSRVDENAPFNEQVEVLTGSSGPFPGSYYTIWIFGAFLILAGFLAVALILNAIRPRNGADSALVMVDDMLRRQSAEGYIAALGLALGGTAFGIALSVVMATDGNPICDHRPLELSAFLIGLGGLAGAVFALWCLILIVLPRGNDR